MKPIRLRMPTAARVTGAGVRSALLVATLLLGSACIADSTDPIDDYDDTAEADDQLHGQSQESVGSFGDEDTAQDDDDDVLDEADEWSDEREEQQVVLPSVLVAEPEPDPWYQPGGSGHDDNGSGNKD